MHSLRLSRSEFVAVMNERGSSQGSLPYYRNAQPDSLPAPGELWALWERDEKRVEEPPQVVVVSDQMVEDFFAWSVTFLPAYRPLTSFLRVLPWSVFTQMLKTKAPASFQRRSILIGLILAETLTNATGRGFIDSLPLSAFESTYSFAIGRAIALGFDDPLLSYIFRGWQSVREFGEQRTRRLSPEILESVWNVVIQLANNRNEGNDIIRKSEHVAGLLRGCEEISEMGQVSSSTLERLTQGRVNTLRVTDDMKLPREQRVLVFERAVRELVATPTNDLGTNFFVGYLASLVGDGSLEHAHLVFPLQDRLPTAMLWYGICASLKPASQVLTDYGHLGLRLLRLLERKEDVFSSPSCDISLPELEILLRGQPSSRSFRQAHASFLRVELAPCITTVIRSIGSRVHSEQPVLFPEDGRQGMLEVDRLRELVLNLKNGLSLAETLLTNANEPTGSSDIHQRSKRRR